MSRKKVNKPHGRRRLRSGFTTGTAAAAAAGGALRLLLDGTAPEGVPVRLLTGDTLTVALHRCERVDERTARCTVIKDAGDDPDVTNGAEIGATVTLVPGGGGEVTIAGGAGVGTVTKPGLEVAPGEPAINPGPRTMIRDTLAAAARDHGLRASVSVEVFVPRGEVLAEKTLNARLGIVGGISILGTTGIVRPLSHEAYTATIRSALSVARAGNVAAPVLTTGRRSERFAQARWPDAPEEAFVQIGDYFQFSLQEAAALGFAGVILAVFFGKAVKMAQGIGHTHAARSALVLDRLARWTLAETGDAALSRAVAGANTARQAFGILQDGHPAVLRRVGRSVVSSAASLAPELREVRVVILDFEGTPVYDSAREERTHRP